MPGAEWIATGHGDKSLWAAAPPMNLLNDRTASRCRLPIRRRTLAYRSPGVGGFAFSWHAELLGLSPSGAWRGLGSHRRT